MTVSANGFSSVFSRGQVRDAFLCHLLLVVAGWRVVGVDDVIVGETISRVSFCRFDGVFANRIEHDRAEEGEHLESEQTSAQSES